MKKLLVSLCTLLVAGSAAIANAEYKPPKTPKAPVKSAVEKAFEKLADSEGQVSEAAFCSKDGKPLEGKPKEAATKKFKNYDIDGNGQLTLEEYKNKGAKPKAAKN